VKKLIYFDHNATAPTHPDVLKAIAPFYKDAYGNASSLHAKGREARDAVDQARQTIGDFLGTEPEDILFTASGTEADNMAVKGIAWTNRDNKRHIITTSIEHKAILASCKQLEIEGFEVTYLPVDKHGLVSPDMLKKAIKKDTCLVSIMHANNEIGTIQPIKELAAIAKAAGVVFHTDAVQTFGKLPIDVEQVGADLLSVSSHKIYGPKGIGALYVRKGIKMIPLVHGGHHERKLRAGTENVAGIVGFGKAVQLAEQDTKAKADKLTALRDKLHKGITEAIKDVYLNGHPTQRLPNTINLSFKFIEGESIMLNLDLKGICVSTGSACTSGTLDPSHVLTAMGIPVDIAQGSIRFSLGNDNTEDEIDYCLEVLPEIIERLRKMSPLKK